MHAACGNERRFDARHFSRNVLPTSESEKARAIRSTAYERGTAAARVCKEVSMKCGLPRRFEDHNGFRIVAGINRIRTENTAFVEYDCW
jgi:hypothetical protein